MDKDLLRSMRILGGETIGGIERIPDQFDMDPGAAQAAHALDFLARRVLGHVDMPFDLQTPAGKGDALRVIAGAGADHALRSLVRVSELIRLYAPRSL